MTAPTAKNTRFPFYLLMALSIIGVGIGVYLTHHFYLVRSGTAGFQSFCHISDKVNCDAVAASRYAELFLGIPLSALSVGWMLGVFAVAILATTAAWRRMGARLLIAMTGVGVLTSLIYFFIMFGVLGTYCVFCLLLDAVNVALFGVALSCLLGDARKEGGDSAEESSAVKTMLGTVVACLFVGVVATKGMDQSNLKQADVQFLAQDILSHPVLPASADEKFPSIGPVGAPVTVVEFSDFQCPFCRMGAMQLNTILNRYPGKIRVVFRNFPLDPSCNSHMQHAGHPYACQAARVGLCAAKQGKFKPYYEMVFENQDKLGPGIPEEFAEKVGVDRAKLEECVKSPEIASAIQGDIEEGTRLGVEGTPTFFINGHKAENGVMIPVWIMIMDQLLGQSS